MLDKLRSSLSNRGRRHSGQPPGPPPVAERKSSTGSPLAWIRRKSSGSVTTLSLHRPSNASLAPAVNGDTDGVSFVGSDTDALGLHIIHEPITKPIADIIFVHGLGGHSYETWSLNRDVNFFWPGRWLPNDSKLEKTRIFTYGYGSKLTGPKSVSNITGFAKSLLFDMRYSRCNRAENLGLGDAPIVFVAHSMGGLVVKKAYLLAQDDENCQTLVRAISGIVFLSTPHRGSNLAQTLGLVLKLAFQPDRAFIAELTPDSSAIEDINEQFRHVAKKLSIISFYETLPTFIGVTIVTKDSALLGYDKEDSRPLDGANHHTVCKFQSDHDSNYILVRDVLKELVEKSNKYVFRVPGAGTSKVAEDVRKLLGITHTPADDLNAFRKRWVSGSCEWILENDAVQAWLTEPSESQLLWYNAPPASGKSVLSSFIIHHLQRNRYDCQFYFFNYRDQTRRSLVGMVKSLAHQMCCDLPDFGAEVLAALPEDSQLDKSDYRLLWQRLFETHFFTNDLKHPLFWVVDGLDESESPDSVIGLLEDLLSRSKTTIKILVTGRRSETLALRFKKLQRHLKVDVIDSENQTHNSRDIELLVAREIEFIPGDMSLKSRLKCEVLQRAKGNFLWVSLVLEKLQMCQTERETQAILNQIPADMTTMYERMEVAITTDTGERRLRLARELLQWAVCVPRPLTLAELSHALRKDYDDIIDLRRTIRDVCGQFLIVDSTDHVTTVHQTARDFLTKGSKGAAAIHRQSANNTLLVRTLSSLSCSEIRESAFTSREPLQVRNELDAKQPFILYGASSWIYHLDHSDPISDQVLDALEAFFSRHCVLDWIYVLATLKEVRTLAKAAKSLLTFISRNRKINDSRNPLLHRLSTIDLLENWAGDLVRLTAKFTKHLITQPHAIYEVVPALCPPASTIHRQFQTLKIVLTGQDDSWNDIFARVSLSQNDVAMKIVSLGAHLAVLTYGGKVYVWAMADFGEVCVLRHGEAVTNMCMNTKGDILVTYGLTITKVWDLPGGSVRMQIPNQGSGRALSLVFASNDQRLIAGIDDKSVRFLQLTDDEATWKSMGSALLTEQVQSPTTIINSPSYMAINAGCTQIGICYRSFPLTVWDLKSAAVVARCMRPNSTLDAPQSWFPVELFAWNSISGHIIGWYKGNKLIKWHPLTDESHEVSASVDELAVSPNGKVFLTSDSDGTVKVWNFAYFAVIYQLSSGDLVSGLSFSPDSSCFYDIRGGTVTAWEPNGLVRLAEAEDTSSDTASDDQHGTMVSHVSEANAPQYTALSVLAASPCGSYYATGNEDGEVHLAECKTESKIELTRFHNFQPIAQLAWSENNEIIAAADLATDVRIMHIRKDESGHLGSAAIEHLSTPKFDVAGSAIHQLLFDSSSHLLLVVSNDIIQTWDIDEGRVKHTEEVPCASQRRWLRHPSDADVFVGVGSDDIQTHQWSDLRRTFIFKFDREQFSLIRQSSTFSDFKSSTQLQRIEPMHLEAKPVKIIQKAMLAESGKHILIHIKEQIALGRVQNRLLVVAAKALEIPRAHADTGMLECLEITNELNQNVEFPLTILSGEQLFFLNQDLWLCSTNLGRQSQPNSFKRHYFIPRDWTDVEGLNLCLMLRDGTLLCPQQGSVVAIKTNFGSIGN
ncbi:hypothetical protein H2200_006989 [Cladophialophora chaetospira]|uniref:GPI inositol-deacylase n=1 Tax=Cladophialophora chaetospira TaxID=386627 RepID=A0AA38X9D1_9EURO|nr:hypothetical protein H2200_006989 [Cladophialophora chaetospira]